MSTTRMTWLRPFTTNLFNPLARRFAGRLPGFGIVSYTGRMSGRRYRTPLNVFRRGSHYVFALTYGSEVNWVQNVLAARECDMEVRGRTVHLVEPELIVDPTRHLVPAIVRVVLRLTETNEFLRLRIA